MGWTIKRADGTYQSWQAADVKPDWVLAAGESLEERRTPPTVGSPLKEQYIELRRRAYPPVGDQLDAFWHAMDQGILPKVEPFYSACAAVKAKYPKPT